MLEGDEPVVGFFGELEHRRSKLRPEQSKFIIADRETYVKWHGFKKIDICDQKCRILWHLRPDPNDRLRGHCGIFRPLVGIKEAVKNAVAFANESLGPAEFQLEELESGVADGQDAWLIPLSRPNPSKVLSFSPDSRMYKVFAVRKTDGEVVSMKIRELAKN